MDFSEKLERILHHNGIDLIVRSSPRGEGDEYSEFQRSLGEYTRAHGYVLVRVYENGFMADSGRPHHLSRFYLVDLESESTERIWKVDHLYGEYGNISYPEVAKMQLQVDNDRKPEAVTFILTPDKSLTPDVAHDFAEEGILEDVVFDGIHTHVEML